MPSKKPIIKFNIESELPGLNEYINLERTNRYSAASTKKKYTDLCSLYSKKIKGKLSEDKLYSIVLNWTVKNNKKDPDNIYFGVKFILDGMVKSGVLKNDNRKYIKNIHHNISTGKLFNVEVILNEEPC